MSRIALISEHASPLAALGGVDSGGQNVYVTEIARQLADSGYEVDIFTRADAPGLPKVVAFAENICIIHLKAGPQVSIKKEYLLPYMSDFAREMISYIKNSSVQYDVIHANFYLSGYVAVIIKQILDIPFLVTFHALGKVRSIFHGNQDNFPTERNLIEKLVMEKASAIIAECPQDKVDMVSLYKVEAGKVFVIPGGVNTKDFYPVPKVEARSRIGVNSNDRLVLHVSRLVPRKGIETVIRGFSDLIYQHGIKAQLLIVGGNSSSPEMSKTPEIIRLQSLAKEYNVANRVKFLGSRQRHELKYFYSAADAFVTTPWYEPFGLTTLEAMACGTPVIGSSVGGLKHTIQDGKSGFLVHPKDWEAVGDKLATLLTNEPLHQHMSQNCIEQVNQRFTWPLVCKEITSLYTDVKRSRIFAAHNRRAAVRIQVAEVQS